MTKAIINGHEFLARDYVPFINDGGLAVMFYVYTDSIDSVIQAVGAKATIEIEGQFIAHDMKIERATMYWDNGTQACEIRFVPFNLTNVVQKNTEDIELNAGAIVELAQLIG